ncbi:MAG TPA: class I SAM-dependent methyltransferase [Spirochaetia bacterium]|nr:class I SAM-dependent methyltransferase [Spirochaetia bacterium]
MSGSDLTAGNTLTFERDDGSLYFLMVSPPPVVEAILELAGLEAGETLYDLGSADGRVIIRAAHQCDIRSVGIESNRDLWEHSRKRIQALGLEDRVTVKLGDLNDENLQSADVIVTYLGREDHNDALRDRFAKHIVSGGRLVTVDCSLAGWEATDRKDVRFSDSTYTVFLYDRRGPPSR